LNCLRSIRIFLSIEVALTFEVLIFLFRELLVVVYRLFYAATDYTYSILDPLAELGAVVTTPVLVITFELKLELAYFLIIGYH